MLLLFISLVGCSNGSRAKTTDLEAKEKKLSSGSVYFLSKEEVNRLIEEANQGEGAAAFRLYQYYTFSALDHSKGLERLEQSVKNGYEPAQKILISYKK